MTRQMLGDAEWAALKDKLRARPRITAACGVLMESPAARRRHGGRRPAIHAFAAISTARRGWSAFADHDGERTVPCTQ